MTPIHEYEYIVNMLACCDRQKAKGCCPDRWHEIWQYGYPHWEAKWTYKTYRSRIRTAIEHKCFHGTYKICQFTFSDFSGFLDLVLGEIPNTRPTCSAFMLALNIIDRIRFTEFDVIFYKILGIFQISRYISLAFLGW